MIRIDLSSWFGGFWCSRPGYLDNFSMANAKGVLATQWENDALLRNRARVLGLLMTWPSEKSTGIPSMKACELNSAALEHLARWWAQCSDLPASIPIDAVRDEVRGSIKQLKKLGV